MGQSGSAGLTVLDITFEGLAAPLRLLDADAVLPVLAGVVVGWPYQCRAADPAASPFFSIRGVPGEVHLWCESHVQGKPSQKFDPVNAVCDAMVALAFAWPAAEASLICLHAAGVAMAGQLVVFPNLRRAGKSTLSAALARAGHPVFSDDVLPLSFATEGVAWGHAMGVAPRLRLPLPMTLPPGFRSWVEAADGPQNRQYKYLNLADQPRHGAMLPVGAFVLLDRQEGSVVARLAPVLPDAAMDALLRQNFTRDRSSAAILRQVAALLTGRPVWQLTYAGLDDAVACLSAAFDSWPDAAPLASSGPALRFPLADLERRRPRWAGVGEALAQRTGVVAEMIGGALYLADPEGQAIQRMDPLAAAIWEALEEPADEAELAAMLVEAFPDENPARVAEDLHRLLDRLTAAGLIEAVPAV